MNVVMAVGGFPTSENPQRGVFNEIAANAIGGKVNLTIVHFRYWKPGRALKKVLENENYTYICICLPTIPFLHRRWSILHFKSYAMFINALLSKELAMADIVHCVQGEIGVWFSMIKRRYSFKLLVQFIGTDLVSEFRDHRTKPWVTNWVDELDAASFNSYMLKNTFEGYYPLFQKAKQVIYRGTDIKYYTPAQRKFDKNHFRFFFLGGLADYKIAEGRNLKGGVDLLHAWISFAPKHPKCKLIFAGADALPNIVANFVNIRTLINFEAIGPLKKEEVLQNYQDADCVIISSRQDGMPNVAFEALACGKPVIGSNVGGIPESVLNGKTGLLFEPGNIVALIEAMDAMSSNSTLYKHISIAARERAVEQLDSRKFALYYEALYRDLCVE